MVCNITVEDCEAGGLVNEEMMFYFRAVNWSILFGIVNIFGILSNGINMVVVYKMGFDENSKINLSLFALAISDFGSCFTSLWLSIAMNPWFRQLDLPFESDEISYLLGAWPHVMFTKITTMITAFITFERCLCVCLPIKIKYIITKKRILCYLVFCYVLNVALMVPIFYSNRIGSRFYVEYNKTMIGLIFTEDLEQIESVVFPFINVFLSIVAFIFIIITTILLVVKLREKSKWRKKATHVVCETTTHDDKTDDDNHKKKDQNESDKNPRNKDQKVAKMVVIISTLFIVCLFPTVLMQIAMWLDRRLSVRGQFWNLNKVMASFTFITESVNAALNIVIYYKNSSNYKAVFDQVFRAKKK